MSAEKVKTCLACANEKHLIYIFLSIKQDQTKLQENRQNADNKSTQNQGTCGK